MTRRARKLERFTFDLACVQCEHSHWRKQVPFASCRVMRPVWIRPKEPLPSAVVSHLSPAWVLGPSPGALPIPFLLSQKTRTRRRRRRRRMSGLACRRTGRGSCPRHGGARARSGTVCATTSPSAWTRTCTRSSARWTCSMRMAARGRKHPGRHSTVVPA